MRRGWWQRATLMAAMIGTHQAAAQQSLADAMRLRGAVRVAPKSLDPAAPATSLEDALHGMFDMADIIFTGTVTKIEQANGVVTIRFRVEDGIRGVATGASYQLREWSGLWADDPARYVQDERRLMLLHAPSRAGYASPVTGSRGAIRVRGDGVQSVADLRWVATDVLAQDASQSLRPMVQPGAIQVPAEPRDAGAVDVPMLSGMLHAWQRDRVAQ